MSNEIYALITRPANEAESTAKAIAAKGYTPLIEPLLTIQPAKDAPEKIATALKQNPQCLIFTSKQALRIFADIVKERKYTVAVVGEASSELATDLGFKRIISGDSDAETLVKIITEKLDPTQGCCVYFCSNHVAYPVEEKLQKFGFSCVSNEIYQSEAVEDFSAENIKQLKNGNVRVALFYSERTAEIFVKLAKKHALEAILMEMEAYALSAKVMRKIRALQWKKTAAARLPSETALLNLVISTPTSKQSVATKKALG